MPAPQEERSLDGFRKDPSDILQPIDFVIHIHVVDETPPKPSDDTVRKAA